MADPIVFENDAIVIAVAVANGQVLFDFDFLAFKADDLLVIHKRGTVLTPLVALAGFTATGLGNENGGAIDITLSAIATLIGDQVIMARDMPIERLAGYVDDFRTNVVNKEFDTLFMLLQQLKRDQARAVAAPITAAPGVSYVLPDPVANKVLGWNNSGNALENKTVADIGGALLSDDPALTDASHDEAVTEYAVKTYVDAIFSPLWRGLVGLLTYAEAWFVLKLNGSLSSRTLIKALIPQVGMSVLLTEGGRTGNFIWTLGDFSTFIAADTQEGWYLKADSLAATVGAWVRADDTGVYNIRKFGAVGDGVANDTPAIVGAHAVAIIRGGGLVRAPAPSAFYRMATPGLTVDYSGAYYTANRLGKKVSLIGDGAGITRFVADAGAFAAFYIKGNATLIETYYRMTGVNISQAGFARTVGSSGLIMEKAAYASLDDVVIEGFDQGLVTTDVEQIGIFNTEIRFNNYGVSGVTGTMTSPNSWSVYNSTASNNLKSGLFIVNANAFNWNGGSIQYNGFIGDAMPVCGAEFVDAGNGGYGTIGFTNMAFEGNGGGGDFYSFQTANACSINFTNVAFERTANFSSATVSGAANNGGGLIRLAVNSTAALAGHPKVYVKGVTGTVEANNAVPWSFTVIDATHIDLIGSAFVNPYVNGGTVSVVGFGAANITLDGAGATIATIRTSAFRSEASYVASATRPTISILNANAKMDDNGSNYFQNAAEKLTYSEAQKIGDDGTAWNSAFVPAVSAAGGTFAATATMRYRRVGKRVDFTAKITVTSYTATPTAPVTMTLPLAAVADVSVSCINMTTVTGTSGIIGATLSTVRIWQSGVFPFTANSQTMAVSGSYETA